MQDDAFLKSEMTMRTLPKAQWQRFFDRLSKDLDGETAVVEVQGLELIGEHRQARCLPLLGITYDQKDNVLEVSMEGLDHLIHAPCDIRIEDGRNGPEAVEIVTPNGQKQIVKVVKPLHYRQRD